MGSTVWGSTSPLSGPAGTGTILAGQSTLTISDPRITSQSIVIAQPKTLDGSGAYVRAVVCSAGTAVVTMSAVVTANTEIGFVILNSTQTVQ